jgi:archaellum component FlaC
LEQVDQALDKIADANVSSGRVDEQAIELERIESELGRFQDRLEEIGDQIEETKDKMEQDGQRLEKAKVHQIN